MQHAPAAATHDAQPPAFGPGGWRSALTAPVDLASLAAFRIAFGLLLCWEVWRYVSHGWVWRYYVEPAFNLTYAGFGWVQPLPPLGMWILFVLLGALALLFTVGAGYRWSAGLLALGFTYVFLLEQARYLNHFYLICLLLFLMAFLPAGRLWSVDALEPRLRAGHGPVWGLWLLRAQLGIVYLYAGLAKVNPDWLGGEPMRTWLADRSDFPLLGRWFGEEWMVRAMSMGGLAFDLLIVPALLWRRTRLPAFLVAVVFHLMNERLFHIGIFPWLAMTATTLFFAPDWPRRVLARIGVRLRPPAPREVDAGVPLGAVGAVVLCAFLSLQVLVPLRHHVIPGDVAWTYEGHRFSWRMKLNSKPATAAFFATDPATGRTWPVALDDHLQDWQARAMAGRPDMVAQFARHLRAHYVEQGIADVEVRADVTAALNSRPPARLVDPQVDLASVAVFDFGRDWVLPFMRTE